MRLPVFFTVFVDSLSWAIVFPIFAPLFLDTGNGLFDPTVTAETRTTVLGFFLMAFSLGQFIGAPLIGAYADSHGRRKALCSSALITVLGLALTALGVQVESLFILFLGRLVTGVFAANMTICLACISDLNGEEKDKVRDFGTLSLIVGLSFVFGAFLGGKLSDPSVSEGFTPDFPLWLAAGLGIVNFCVVYFGFRETSTVVKEMQFSFFNVFAPLKEALKTKKIMRIYLIYFLFLFAWTILFQFTPILVVRDFQFTSSNIGDLALFMGVCWAIGSGYLSKILLHHFSTLKILESCLLGFTVLSFLFFFSDRIYEVLFIVAAGVLVGGLAWPLCTGLISGAATREMQGKVLGISQSVQSLSMALAPAIGGVAYQVFPTFPFLIGAFATLLASILYYSLRETNP